jgi:hypothetical protein
MPDSGAVNLEAALAQWMKGRYPGYTGSGLGHSVNGVPNQAGTRTQVFSHMEPCESCGMPVVVLQPDGRPKSWYSSATAFWNEPTGCWRAFWDKHTPSRCRAERTRRDVR